MDLVRDSRLPDRNLGSYQLLDKGLDLSNILRRPDVRRVGFILQAFYDNEDERSSVYFPSPVLKNYSQISLVSLFKEFPSGTIDDLDRAENGAICFGKELFSVRKPGDINEVIESATRSYVLQPSLSFWELIPGVIKPVKIILGIRAGS